MADYFLEWAYLERVGFFFNRTVKQRTLRFDRLRTFSAVRHGLQIRPGRFKMQTSGLSDQGDLGSEHCRARMVTVRQIFLL